MSVDAATVRRIAHLARIAVEDGEIEHLRGEINAILAFVAQLEEVNVEGVEPMTSVTPMKLKMREDKVTDGGDAARVLRTRPRRRTGSFWCRKWWSEGEQPYPPRGRLALRSRAEWKSAQPTLHPISWVAAPPSGEGRRSHFAHPHRSARRAAREEILRARAGRRAS